jgi:hypothetical protein
MIVRELLNHWEELSKWCAEISGKTCSVQSYEEISAYPPYPDYSNRIEECQYRLMELECDPVQYVFGEESKDKALLSLLNRFKEDRIREDRWNDYEDDKKNRYADCNSEEFVKLLVETGHELADKPVTKQVADTIFKAGELLLNWNRMKEHDQLFEDSGSSFHKIENPVLTLHDKELVEKVLEIVREELKDEKKKSDLER